MRQTLREEFDHALRLHATKVAVEFGPRQLTYAEVDRWSTAIARQLYDNGVRAGDVVALCTRNCPEFLVVDIAIARLGGVKLPVNYMLPAATVSYALRKSNARMLVFGTSVADLATRALGEGPPIPRLQVSDGPGDPVPEVEPLAEVPDEPPAPLDYRKFPVTARGPAALYFTGGTTGLPKGVLHSQSSTVSLHYAQLLEAEIAQDERLLLMTPMAHAAGLFAQSALIRGATSVLVDGFDVDSALRVIEERAITWCFLVPTMIYRLLDALTGRADRALPIRTIVYGASPISPARLEQALRVFGPVFVQLYGQTEAPNWGTRLSKTDHDLARPQLLTSCGQASIMADVQVVDDRGVPAPAGETGEICLRAPYTLDEYLDDPQGTADKFLGDWIRTGDIGLMDEHGYLYLRDRKNDMVISGGMNVYCREVEDVLSRHPSVRAVAVIGIPHDDWGEAVHAVIVPATAPFSDTELLSWARDRLARYARPKSVELVETLPETPFGKVDKKILRAPYWTAQDRAIG